MIFHVGLPFVHVTKYSNKYFLHNGYHRVYGARMAGGNSMFRASFGRCWAAHRRRKSRMIAPLLKRRFSLLPLHRPWLTSLEATPLTCAYDINHAFYTSHGTNIPSSMNTTEQSLATYRGLSDIP